jgi:hypothetical protein
MLTAEHCYRRAERFRLKSFIAGDDDKAMRLVEIAVNYRRLAARVIATTPYTSAISVDRKRSKQKSTRSIKRRSSTTTSHATA